MFGNAFTIWHLLIALFVIALIALIVWAIVRAARSTSPAPHGRLAQLEDLRTTGRVTDAEYQAKRAEILGEL